MRLPDPRRSYAVLIGTSTYRSHELRDLPAVANNLRDLAAILTNPGLGGLLHDHCIKIPDPAEARGVFRTLRRYSSLAEDTLLVYFAGHGRIGPRNELYLSLADTDPDELAVSALAYELIRDLVSDSAATNRVVILDCCFSGQAIHGMSGEDDAAILGQVGIEGTYILTATPATALALAPPGAKHTAFTGELLRLLQGGVPGGPDLLTFSMIYRRLRSTATTRGLPKPQQRGTGTVDQLALAHNPAAISRHKPTHAEGALRSNLTASSVRTEPGKTSARAHRTTQPECPVRPKQASSTAHAQPLSRARTVKPYVQAEVSQFTKGGTRVHSGSRVPNTHSPLRHSKSPGSSDRKASAAIQPRDKTLLKGFAITLIVILILISIFPLIFIK